MFKLVCGESPNKDVWAIMDAVPRATAMEEVQEHWSADFLLKVKRFLHSDLSGRRNKEGIDRPLRFGREYLMNYRRPKAFAKK